MSKIGLAGATIVIGGLVMVCISQHRSKTFLREQNQALAQQLDQLAAENERLSNSLSAASVTHELPDDQLAELLRLRNEVSMLRGLTNQPDAKTDPKIADLEIISARFGSGTNQADVTARVVELLHSEPKGFTARADWLRVDPAPYRSKTLLIFYNYGGRQNLFSVAGGERVSYNLLVANAGQ